MAVAPSPWRSATIELNGYSVAVVEVLRGDAVLANLLAMNSFNVSPAAGTEYVQIHLSVANDGSGPDIGSQTQAYRLTGSRGISFDPVLVFQRLRTLGPLPRRRGTSSAPASKIGDRSVAPYRHH